MAANPEFNNCKKLIGIYLKGQVNYPKEIAIAKKLLKLYPIEFYESFATNESFFSLSVFLTPVGLRELKNQFALFELTKPPTPIILSEESQIELSFTEEEKKPKTILEFVDNK
jgi:hypothetical protein